MPNYRGGERRIDQYAAQLIDDIRKGNTTYQKDRAFRDKMIQGGLQAGVTAAAGIGSGLNSIEVQRGQRERAAAAADKESMRKQGEVDAGIMRDSEQYRAPDYVAGPEENNRPVPAWLEAEKAQSRLDGNGAAANTSMGGYSTQEGRENHADLANAMANDIQTAQDGIKMGGMMKSLPGVPR